MFKKLIPFLLVLSLMFVCTPVATAANMIELTEKVEGIYKQLALAGIPIGKASKVFFVDPANGYDTNSGLTPEKPLKTVTKGEDKCVANRNDCVVMIGGPTGDTVADTITWDKSYTHLVGLSGNLSTGQRCRIVGGAATDEATVITVSGNGCIFKNIQFYNGGDTAALAAAAVVTGSRNRFENVFFAGMGHATSANFATGYSLSVGGGGEENEFVNCTIGLDTILRDSTGVLGELLITGNARRTKFTNCEFKTQSNTASKVLVTVAAGAELNDLQFTNCLFNNFKSNNGATGTALSNAITDGATAYHAIILRGSNLLVGVTGWADVVTYIMTPGVNGAGTYGVGTAPTT